MFEMIINGSIFLVRLPIGTLGPRTVRIQIVHIQILVMPYFLRGEFGHFMYNNVSNSVDSHSVSNIYFFGQKCALFEDLL